MIVRAFEEIVSFVTRTLVSIYLKLKYSVSLFRNGAFVHWSASIHWSRNSRFQMGRESRIGRHSMLVFAEGSEFVIGRNSFIGYFANVRISRSIRIGSDCRIAQFVSFIGDNHNFDSVDIPIYQQGVTPKDIIIGDNVWIGTHVVILPGVTIGSGSVIGAGSVVTKSIPPNSIAVGNPARVIRSRTQKD